MGLEILMLLISSGVLTELVKFGLKQFNLALPPNAQPLLAAALAELQAQTVTGGTVGGVPVPDFSNLSAIGALTAGLAATGLHQTAFAHKYIRKDDSTAKPTGVIKGIYPFLLPVLFLALSGCASFKQEADIRMKTDQGCQALAIMSQAIVDQKAKLDPLGDESVRAQATVQGLIRVLGSNCVS